MEAAATTTTTKQHSAAPEHKERESSRHTQDQRAKIQSLQRLLHEHFTPPPPMLATLQRILPYKDGDAEEHNPEWFYCASFLASREWDVQRALAMMKEVVAYRAANHLDDVSQLPSAVSVRGWDAETVCAAVGKTPRPAPNRVDRIVAGVAQHLACGVHYWDKGGRPVVYVMIDSLDEPGMMAKLKANAKIGQKPSDVMWEYGQHFLGVGEDLVLYQLQQQRTQGKAHNEEEEEEPEETQENSHVSAPSSSSPHPACSVAHGVITLVMDLKGLHMGLLWKPMIDLFRDVTRELFKYYPDMVHRILAVNAPGLVRVAFNMVKSVMPADFQKKISFVSPPHTLAALEEEIDSAHIPAFLGGSCHCAHQGGGTRGCCIDGYNRDDPRRRKTSDTAKTAKNASAAAGTGSSEHVDENEDDKRKDSDEDGRVREGDVAPTEDIALSAGQRHRRMFQLKPSDTVGWEFAVPHDGASVTFTVYFVSHTQASSFLGSEVDWARVDVKKLEPYQLRQSATARQDDAFTAKESGTLVLSWHNTRSWFKTRSVQLRVYKDSVQHQQE